MARMTVHEFLTWLRAERAERGLSTSIMARRSNQQLTRTELDRILRDGHSSFGLDILLRLTSFFGAKVHIEVPDVDLTPYRSPVRRRGMPPPE